MSESLQAADGASALLPSAPRYRLLRSHARGGLGQLSIALDAELGREVAFKEMLPECADDADSRERFLREGAITGRLEHPGIVPVYSLGIQPNGRPFYTMRFIQGNDLRTAIHRYHDPNRSADDPSARSLEFRGLLRRFIDVSNAVAFAHARGVLHRDLKPANVMLGPFGETLVVDWGLAKENRGGLGAAPPTIAVAQADAGEETPAGAVRDHAPPTEIGTQASITTAGQDGSTRPGEILGTPAYMSPEQAAGATHVVGPASDIFSLGAMLYELLTGRLPFPGNDTAEVLARVAIGRFQAPRQVEPSVAKPLDAICRKALALQPADRYATALDLAADLEHWLADEPVSAYRESPVERARRWGRRNRPVVASAVALLAALACAFAAGFFLVRHERDQKERARKDAIAARDAEVAARQQTRAALNLTTDDVIERLLWQQRRLRGDERAFLQRIESHYRRFAETGGQSREARFSSADGYFRVARIRQRLEDLAGAEAAYRAAVAEFQRLADDSPDDSAYRLGLANSRMNLGVLFERTGRLDDAETEYREAISGHIWLAERLPDHFDHPYYLGKLRDNLASLLAETGRPADAESEARSAVDVHRRLARMFADEARAQHALGKSLTALGSVLQTRGRFAEALDAYRDALKLMQAAAAKMPDAPEHLRDLGTTWYGIGGLMKQSGRYQEAAAAYREAVRITSDLADAYPSSPQFRFFLAHSRKHLASLRFDGNRSREADPMLQAAILEMRRLSEESSDVPEYRRELAQMLNEQALTLAVVGKRKEAVESFDAAVTLWRRLASETPNVPAFRAGLANSLNDLANTNRTAGGNAEPIFREALSLRRKLADDYPDAPEYRQHLAATLQNFGNHCDDNGRAKDAEPLYRESIALLTALVRDFPDVPGYQQDVAKGYTNLSVMLFRSKRFAEAEKTGDESLDQLRRLAARWPEIAEHRYELATSLTNQSSVFAGTLRLKESEPLARDALAVLEKLVDEHPDVVEFRGAAARAAHSLAVPALWRNDPPAIRAALEKGRTHLAALRHAGALTRDLLPLQRSTMWNLANALARLGDHRALSEAAADLSAFSPDPARDAVEAARFLARAATLSLTDSTLSWWDRPARAERYALAAERALQRGIAAGFRDAKPLQAKEFDVLRARPQFQKLQVDISRE